MKKLNKVFFISIVSLILFFNENTKGQKPNYFLGIWDKYYNFKGIFKHNDSIIDNSSLKRIVNFRNIEDWLVLVDNDSMKIVESKRKMDSIHFSLRKEYFEQLMPYLDEGDSLPQIFLSDGNWILFKTTHRVEYIQSSFKIRNYQYEGVVKTFYCNQLCGYFEVENNKLNGLYVEIINGQLAFIFKLKNGIVSEEIYNEGFYQNGVIFDSLKNCILKEPLKKSD